MAKTKESILHRDINRIKVVKYDGRGSSRKAPSLYKDLEIGSVPLTGSMERPSLIVGRLRVGV